MHILLMGLEGLYDCSKKTSCDQSVKIVPFTDPLQAGYDYTFTYWLHNAHSVLFENSKNVHYFPNLMLK